MPINPALLKKRIRYLLLARFSQDIAAPLPASLAVDVGAITVIDDSSIMSQSGGRRVVNGTAAAESYFHSALQARLAGRTWLWRVPVRTTVGSGTRYAWDTSVANGNLTYGFRYSSTTAIVVFSGGTSIDTITIGSGEHHFALVQRGTGAHLLARNGTSGDYTRLWVYNTGTADLYAKNYLSGAQNFVDDDWRILDLANIAEAYTSRLASPSAGATTTSTADAWNEVTITAATGVTQEWSIRRADDSNRWIVRMDQAGSTVKLIEVVAGVETERGSAAQTWTNATQYRVVDVQEGSVIKLYVANTLKITYSSASFNATAAGLKVSHDAVEMIAWPRTINLPGGI